MKQLAIEFTLHEKINNRGYRETSRMAYRDAKEGIGDKQSKVLSAIKVLGACTDKQISDYLNCPINRVTPRRGELVSMGKVVECGKIKNECNRNVLTWRIK